MRQLSFILAVIVAGCFGSWSRAQDLGGAIAPTATPEKPATGDTGSVAAAEAGPPASAPVNGVSLPPPPENVQSQFEVVKNGDARDLADAWIRAKGWKLGWDLEKGWGVWLGTSSLLAPDPTGLAVSLNGAAMNAKFQFAEYLGAVISTASLSTLEKNPAQIKAERDRMDAEAKRPGGDPVASAIRDLLDAGSGGGVDTGVQRRTRVSTASLTAAQAAIPGMMVAQTFVKTDTSGLDGTVAVVVVSTPRSRAIADAMLKGQAMPKGAADPSRTLRAYVDSLSLEALVYGTGASYRMNEKGDLCALGYGVGSVDDGADADDVRLAQVEAEQAATGELRNVAGELIIGRRLLSRVAERTQWVDGKQARESRKGVLESVGTIANGLQTPGIATVETKRIRHPVMGDLVCVVRSWNLAEGQAAANLRQQFEAQGGWKGGAGVQPTGPGAQGNSADPVAPTRRPGIPSGQGGGGIEEP